MCLREKQNLHQDTSDNCESTYCCNVDTKWLTWCLKHVSKLDVIIMQSHVRCHITIITISYFYLDVESNCKLTYNSIGHKTKEKGRYTRDIGIMYRIGLHKATEWFFFKNPVSPCILWFLSFRTYKHMV